MKIGITIGLKDKGQSIWTNGVRLNVLMFARMLKHSTRNYEVCLLNTQSDYTPDYDTPVYPFADKYLDMDLIILMGAQVPDHYLQTFRKDPDKRIVSYRCGNEYVLYTQQVLFNPGKAYHFETADETWYVPQQHATNYGFLRTLHRNPTLPVPFVWDKHYLLQGLADIQNGYQQGKHKKGYQYEPKETKTIGVMEPNLDTIKFGLIPLLIAEESYRRSPYLIDRVLVTNADKLAKNRTFMSTVETLDLYRDNKIRAEARYQTAYFLTQHADVLVCHQLLNPLNYLYLDAAYMQYPVIHNAPFCKDLGYYYHESDTEHGADKLDYALRRHDANREEYAHRNKRVLWRYSAANPDITATYDALIDNLFNGGNKPRPYNPSTNLYQ